MPAKAKKITYKPTRMVKQLETSLSKRAAMVPEVIREEDLKRKAIRMHIRGRDHEYISAKLNLSRDTVHSYIKEKLQAYIRESFDPAEVREIMAKRYDNIMYDALYNAMPHPKTDQFGRPVMGNICKCELDEGVLCSEPGHVVQAMTKPDPTWAKIYLEILKEIKNMFGVDAADKMKQQIVDKMERTYRGVSAEVIENL